MSGAGHGAAQPAEALAMKQFLYGPVPSRRLGRSLGIDVIPYKTCTYDCIYCQLGRTTVKTLERKEYVPLAGVAAEMDRKGHLLEAADFITIAGSGEPTLYARLGELIAAVRQRTRTPVAVITNGSLLWDGAVQEALQGADLVIPSLDAGDAGMFRHINRPHPGISFERMVQGLADFRAAFKGRIWLEVLLVGGATGIASEVRKIAGTINLIRPDRVQVNTAVRPPAEDFAYTVAEAQLDQLARLLGPDAQVIAEFSSPEKQQPLSAAQEDILVMLRRRPCTLADIVGGLGVNWNDAIKQVDRLVAEGRISAVTRKNRTFYNAADDGAGPPRPAPDKRP